MWFWSMKAEPNIPETPTKGTTPTTRKKSMSEIPFCPCWQQHYLTDFISLYVLLVWKGEKAEGKISFPHISSFPQHPDISLVPTTYGKSNRLSKLPGHRFGMRLKTKVQPMASATTSKSELSFVLYLYSRMRLRQHGNTFARQRQTAIGTESQFQSATASTQVQPQTRAHNGSARWYLSTRFQTSWTQQGEFNGLKVYLPETGNMPSFVNSLVEALTSSNAVPAS